MTTHDQGDAQSIRKAGYTQIQSCQYYYNHKNIVIESQHATTVGFPSIYTALNGYRCFSWYIIDTKIMRAKKIHLI